MTDQEIEAKVIDIATHIWDKRDVVASRSLIYTHCTECSDKPFGLKSWCLPSITDMSTMCASCFVHKRIQELRRERDVEARRELCMAEERKMFRDLGASVARQLTNNPPKEWRQPKLDVEDFASIK